MKILVGVDLHESTEKFINKVEEIANPLSAEVWLLHVAEPDPEEFVGYIAGPDVVRDSLAKKFKREHQQIQKIAGRLRETNLDTTALLIQGATATTILNEASKLGVDIIVLGSHGRGMAYELLVGSVCEEVLHKTECPIFIIPTHERT